MKENGTRLLGHKASTDCTFFILYEMKPNTIFSHNQLNNNLIESNFHIPITISSQENLSEIKQMFGETKSLKKL